MPQTLEDVSTSFIELKKNKKVTSTEQTKEERIHTQEQMSTHGFMDSM